jgi:hypothetical protein
MADGSSDAGTASANMHATFKEAQQHEAKKLRHNQLCSLFPS